MRRSFTEPVLPLVKLGNRNEEAAFVQDDKWEAIKRIWYHSEPMLVYYLWALILGSQQGGLYARPSVAALQRRNIKRRLGSQQGSLYARPSVAALQRRSIKRRLGSQQGGLYARPSVAALQRRSIKRRLGSQQGSLYARPSVAALQRRSI